MPLSSKPFGLLFEALDDLKPNEIYICTGASPRVAPSGGLMSTRALRLKAAGAVLDGYVRDTHEIFNLRFPVFAYGSFAQDQGPRGKVMDFRVPVEIGGVRIDPGDIVFADVDGVLIIPRVGEREAFTRALEKARGEKKVRKAIEGGIERRPSLCRTRHHVTCPPRFCGARFSRERRPDANSFQGRIALKRDSRAASGCEVGMREEDS